MRECYFYNSKIEDTIYTPSLGVLTTPVIDHFSLIFFLIIPLLTQILCRLYGTLNSLYCLWMKASLVLWLSSSNPLTKLKERAKTARDSTAPPPPPPPVCCAFKIACNHAHACELEALISSSGEAELDWSLDSGLNWTMDWTLDWTLDWTGLEEVWVQLLWI